MGHNSPQVCMDSSDWLQGSIHEDQSPMESSSPLSGDILTCSRPLIERRLRPPHDQSLKCPRCDSTHTKFCYYNNYSLSQPRYFCKTCRRYWTKGGTLRNIPVGGGCRKNKKVASKKQNEDHSPSMNPNHLGSSSTSSHHNRTDLQLSFPDQMQFSHLNNLMLGAQGTGNPSFMDGRYGNINGMLENSNQLRPIDFMERKLEAIVGNARNYDFMGGGGDSLGIVGGLSNMGGGAHGLESASFHGFCSSPFGSMSLDHQGNNNGNNFMENCQRLMLPYEANENHQHHQNEIHDVKPNTKLLSLEWQEQGCSDAGKESSYGYLNGLGSWTGVMNNFGPSATNSLV